MKLVGLLRMVLPNYQPGYEMLKGPLFFLFSCCLLIWKIDELVTMEISSFFCKQSNSSGGATLHIL